MAFCILCERLDVAKGQSVSVDATNIERECRVFALGKMSGYLKMGCYYFDT